ncbi:MAG: Holliday junction branch migration protein RuvA [Lachnospiraceae bacterium]|jgi:Holliday junction DNA helicase RuvA|nr:Holliday junction branch migration protein RuvA [Lachnospiraceae bacterium]
MFAYIKGELVLKANTYVVIDVQGIGYKIHMSQKAIELLGEIGEIVKVYTYHYVREDNISLYGFITNEELRMFELLLSVSGIGAKLALTILSERTPASFVLAVITNDVSKLVNIPGIGAKSAARIILELKDKLKALSAFSQEETEAEAIKEDTKTTEAIAALQVLGYTRKEIEKALEKVDLEKLGLEDIIRKALALLAK